ncbi:MAG: sulfurtransferase TusA family protein [Firmicutes bacterium]|nr:sulfurtransferase TusA family protein [Bacillota bacterium]
MSNYKVDATLDITDVLCPVTFARTLLKLEDMMVGEILEVFLNDGEPLQKVPKSITDEGHRVILIEKVGDKNRMLVERGE